MARTVKAKAPVTENTETTSTENTTAQALTRGQFELADYQDLPAFAIGSVTIPPVQAGEDAPAPLSLIVVRESGRSFHVFHAADAVPDDNGALIYVDYLTRASGGTIASAAKAALAEAGIDPKAYMLKGSDETFKEAYPMPSKAGDNEPETDFSTVEGIDALKLDFAAVADDMAAADKTSRANWLSFGKVALRAQEAFAKAFPDAEKNRHAFGKWIRVAFDDRPDVLARVENNKDLYQARFMASAPLPVIEVLNANTAGTFEKNALKALRDFAGGVVLGKVVEHGESIGMSVAELDAALNGENARADLIATVWGIASATVTAKAESLHAELVKARDAFDKARETDDMNAHKKAMEAEQAAKAKVREFDVVKWLFAATAETAATYLSGRALSAVLKAVTSEATRVAEKAATERKEAEQSEAEATAKAQAFADMTALDAATLLFGMLQAHGDVAAVLDELEGLAAGLIERQREEADNREEDEAHADAAASAENEAAE